MLLFVAGIGTFARQWWEPLVYALFNQEFGTTLDTNVDYIASSVLFGLGLSLLLLNRYDENKQKKIEAELSNKTLAQNVQTTGDDHTSVTVTGNNNPTTIDRSTHIHHHPNPESPPQKELDQLPFQDLRLGELDEFVGRSEALTWLEDELFKQQKTKTLAIVSVQGAGGMGKTFLAHKFVQQHQTEHTFVEIFVGERSAFETGIEFLSRLGQDISGIQAEDQLRQALQHHFSRGSGVLVLDDVWNADVTLLIPDNLYWQTLITTRNFALAKKLTKNRVLELDKLSLDEAIQLFKIVLNDDFNAAQETDYKELAEHLGLRPYGIRLAANSLRQSDFSRTTPQALLAELNERGLQKPRPDYAEDEANIRQLRPLLEHCLEQLEQESVFARSLLNKLTVCADEGIEAEYLMQWQQQECPDEDIQHALIQIKNFGLLFLEKQRLSIFGEEKIVERIRLHTDLLNLLREASLEKERQSLQAFLYQTLVVSNESIEAHRTLQFQINALIAGLQQNPSNTESLYDQFWIHLRRTGRLQWAYELGSVYLKDQEKDGDKVGLYVAYGNQALILQAWGKLEQAMTLHQKEEKLCEELGDQAGLSRSYGNQALILKAWGKLDEAMALLQKQEKLKEDLGDQAGLSLSYGNQALILKAWGKLEDAMALHQKEEKLCGELGDQAGLSACYGNQAVILQAWGKLEDAMALHQKEEKLCEELGDQAGLSVCYNNQAVILQAWGKLDEAMALQQKKAKLCEKLGDKAKLLSCYWNMGLLYKQMNDHSTAIEKLEQAIELGTSLKRPDLPKLKEFLESYRQEIKDG